MGLRFQRRVCILPGVTLNFSRKGVSTSVGVRGARVTFGHGQRRITTGVPGTGLSHTTVTRTRNRTGEAADSGAHGGRRWVAVVLVCVLAAIVLAAVLSPS
ncbi:MAG: DUF4236 domain-containing protein [Burkholderiaceae bacterium]|nr:MAG: DUF4236 domain-containing protein [Burkholderiaceae bacterium]